MIHHVTMERHDSPRMHQIAGLLGCLDETTRDALLECFSPEEQARLLAVASLAGDSAGTSTRDLMESLLQQLRQPWADRDSSVDDFEPCLTLPAGSGESPDPIDPFEAIETPRPSDPIAHLLQRSDPHELAAYLEHEHPQLIAAVLGLCDDGQARTILASLKSPLRDDVERRWTDRRELRTDIATELRCELLNQLANQSAGTGTDSRSTYHG